MPKSFFRRLSLSLMEGLNFEIWARFHLPSIKKSSYRMTHQPLGISLIFSVERKAQSQMSHADLLRMALKLHIHQKLDNNNLCHFKCQPLSIPYRLIGLLKMMLWNFTGMCTKLTPWLFRQLTTGTSTSSTNKKQSTYQSRTSLSFQNRFLFFFNSAGNCLHSITRIRF